MEQGSRQPGTTTGSPPADQRWHGQGRAPFQILVLPFYETALNVDYAVFRRADAGYWQFIAGGGEGSELPLEAARREAEEEAAIPASVALFRLDSCNTVPVTELAGHLRWGPDVLVVPEYTFAVRIMDPKLKIAAEHTAYRWVDYETCRDMLHWESNRNALHELNHRIRHGMIPAVAP